MRLGPLPGGSGGLEFALMQVIGGRDLALKVLSGSLEVLWIVARLLVGMLRGSCTLPAPLFTKDDVG